MRSIAIVEFWLIVFFIILAIILFNVATKIQKENIRLKVELTKAKSSAEYTEKLMELKDESYRSAKEKNKKIDNGSKHDRIAAAGDVLCND